MSYYLRIDKNLKVLGHGSTPHKASLEARDRGYNVIGTKVVTQVEYDKLKQKSKKNPSKPKLGILKPKLGKWIPVKAVKFLKSGITQIMK